MKENIFLRFKTITIQNINLHGKNRKIISWPYMKENKIISLNHHFIKIN